ncbi:MAG: 3'(2'),5'-bisphosphate nucleotidase CysQ [Gemmataceae bacterium]|nr:3'(2'),5'-bisphosphate nucleotidase CysQ [Gemmataceae bacterium]
MFERELEVALDAVDQAWKHLDDAYQKFQAIPNAPANITTEADRQVQEIVLRHLHAAFPEDSLCAEEATESLNTMPNTGDRLWIVDPIDGTRGFAQKNGEFSVMVGFLERGELAVGIVAQPAAKRLTYAVRGGGCWRRDGGGAPVRCQVGSAASLDQATLTQSRSKTPGKRSPMVQVLNPANILESYSAGIKLAFVARGEADIYLNDYDAFRDWDIAAGHILVTEAGGRATGIAGQPLRYGIAGAWQRDGLIATNGRVHDLAIQRLQSLK